MPALTSALASVLALTLLVPAVAEARQRPEQQKQQRPNAIENLLRLDANGDQTIDREEVPESALDAFDKILEQSDRNHNGKLEAEEIRATLESLRNMSANPANEAQARFKAMDGDGDGKISKQEFKGPETLFSRLDANADGFIDGQEAIQAYRRGNAATPAPNPDRLRRLDANGDGKISRDEFPGADEAFNRLDTNQDGSLDATDRPNTQPPPRSAPARPAQDRPSFSRMDADNDGKVSKSEFQGPENMFARLDANADGSITADEFPSSPGRTNRPGRAAAGRRPNATPADSPLFMRLDKNNDGKVTRDEAEGRAGQFFDRMDTNADGAVTPEEAAQAAARFRNRRPAREPEPRPEVESNKNTAEPSPEP